MESGENFLTQRVVRHWNWLFRLSFPPLEALKSCKDVAPGDMGEWCP